MLQVRPPVGPVDGLVGDVAAVSERSLSLVYATAAQRVAVVDWMAALIAGRFYDPGLNNTNLTAAQTQAREQAVEAQSDQALYVSFKALAAAVKDSHTTVLTPRESADARGFVSTRLGFVLTVIDGQVVVAAVEPNGAASQAGLVAGDLIQSIDGVAVGAVEPAPQRAAVAAAASESASLVALNSAVSPALLPYAGALPDNPVDANRVRLLHAALRIVRRAPDAAAAPVRIVVASDGAAPRDLTLTPLRNARPSTVTLRWLDDGVAVLQFNRFQQQSVEALRVALESMMDARAVIIDLRGNAGGSFDVYRWFAGRFMAEPRAALRVGERSRPGAASQRVSAVKVSPAASGPLLREAPLAVLIDGRTASAAELTAVTLSEQRGAVLVGEPTCGCATGVRNEYVLPDGGGLRIAELGFQSAQGARFEGAPTQPGMRVIPTLDDLRAGRDPVLEAASRRLSARLARHPDASVR